MREGKSIMPKILAVVAVTLALLSILLPLHQAMSDTTATVSVEPQNSFGLLPDDTLTINITVSNVNDLYAWAFHLYYDSSVLNGTSFVEGPFLQTGGFNTWLAGPPEYGNFTDNYNSTHGFIFISCTRIGMVPGATGSGTLATVTFKAKGYGYSILHLEETTLYDSATPFGNLIPHTDSDGHVYVGQVNVAIGEIDADSSIPQGSMSLINVTAQNRGQTPETFDVTLSYDGNPIDGTKTVVNLAGGDSEILTFAWDTTPVPVGEYNLTGTASAVYGEIDFNDNTLSIMVQVGIRDLAVIDITQRTVVGQGYTVGYNVTVQNNGQTTETADLTLYVDSHAIGNASDPLASGAQETISFRWNTTQVVYGNHNMTAYIWPLSFEANTTNNNITQTVHVGIPGDISGTTSGVYDGKVDMRDISYLVLRFNSRTGYPNWKPNADINDDGTVNMRDISIAILNFNKHE